MPQRSARVAAAWLQRALSNCQARRDTRTLIGSRGSSSSGGRYSSPLRNGPAIPLSKNAPPRPEIAPDFEFDDNIVRLTPAGKALLRDAYRRSKLTYEALARRVGVSRNHACRCLMACAAYRRSRVTIQAAVNAGT